MEIIPVILCGGSGTRLWPLSRNSFPKQFLSLPGNTSEDSLFQQAILRGRQLSQLDKNLRIVDEMVVCSEPHRFLILEQLRQIDEQNVSLLLEPVGRNTATALTLAALNAIVDEQPHDSSSPILVVMPADQIIQKTEAFLTAIQNAVTAVAQDHSANTIALLGIHPANPETGYGYINCDPQTLVNGVCDIKQFCEKPDLATAQQYCASGNYFWNSGIFILRANTWLRALSQFRSDILQATQLAWSARQVDVIHDGQQKTHLIRPDSVAFEKIPSESIDYAVIENCPNSPFTLKMASLDAGWSDLGSWDAVWKTAKKDACGNIAEGDTLLLDAHNCLVHATDRLVTLAGLDNVIVIDTADALLVMDQSCSQAVKQVVGKLSANGRQEVQWHRKVYRPWGWYDSIEEGPGFKVKRILVRPGASLSLQKHQHRAEHWVVVKGQAEVTNGAEVLLLSENQSTYIPKGQIHRLRNLGPQDLEIIEIQSGHYLGEDDIERLEDIYGRQ